MSGLCDMLCHANRLQQVSEASHMLIIQAIEVQVEITHDQQSAWQH